MQKIENVQIAPEARNYGSPELIVPLPDFWIDHVSFGEKLPPYYKDIITNYGRWLDASHASLDHLPWGENLTMLHTPRNPEVRQREAESPSTYPIYEALYMFTVGIATGEIAPDPNLDPKLYPFLKQKIFTNLTELMSAITYLGQRRIGFDVEQRIGRPKNERTFRLLNPKATQRGRGNKNSTFASLEYSQLKISYDTKQRSLEITHHELDNFRYKPAEVNGIAKSGLAGLRIERWRSGVEERHLQMDIDIRDLVWGPGANDRIVSVSHVDILELYLGPDKHHLDLALKKGNGSDQNYLDEIKIIVMDELGLSPLIPEEQKS